MRVTGNATVDQIMAAANLSGPSAGRLDEKRSFDEAVRHAATKYYRLEEAMRWCASSNRQCTSNNSPSRTGSLAVEQQSAASKPPPAPPLFFDLLDAPSPGTPSAKPAYDSYEKAVGGILALYSRAGDVSTLQLEQRYPAPAVSASFAVPGAPKAVACGGEDFFASFGV
jgi:hypothetical protein